MGLLMAGAALLPPQADAQPKAASGTPATAEKPTASDKVATTRPLWRELTPKQQETLQPLAAHWDTLNPAHKRKWLALLRSNTEMSNADRATLQSRMSEWAGLSNQQRAIARFNFAEVKQVPVDERKAKWESYQALSDAQRRELAERANTSTRGATIISRPVPLQKLAPLPSGANKSPHSPRIQLEPPPASSPTLVQATQPAATTPPAAVPATAEVPAVAATMPAPSPPAAVPPAARFQPAPLTEAP